MLSARGETADEILASLSEDDRLGARAVHYRGGDVIARINRHYLGSIEKRPITKNKMERWMISLGWWPYYWQVDAQIRGGSCFMSTNASSRIEAIGIGKNWIDAQLEK